MRSKQTSSELGLNPSHASRGRVARAARRVGASPGCADPTRPPSAATLPTACKRSRGEGGQRHGLISSQALSSTLANFGTVGERILQALPGMARNFFTVPGAAVTGKKSGVPYFSAHSAQEPLQNWPKSSSGCKNLRAPLISYIPSSTRTCRI